MNNGVKKILLPIVAVVVIAVVFILSNKSSIVSASNSTSIPLTRYESNGSFVIPIKELTNEVKFFSLDNDGVNVEILAAKDKNGNPKATLNTCQNCMGSPYAYFLQDEDSVVCQNCGIGHKIETIGIAKRGCNPIPIDSLAIDDNNITFDKNELLANTDLFRTIEKE